MVELSPDDYGRILRWFEAYFGKGDPNAIPMEHRRTFWKLTFLAEDKIDEVKQELKDEDD